MPYGTSNGNAQCTVLLFEVPLLVVQHHTMCTKHCSKLDYHCTVLILVNRQHSRRRISLGWKDININGMNDRPLHILTSSDSGFSSNLGDYVCLKLLRTFTNLKPANLEAISQRCVQFEDGIRALFNFRD